jgi:O-antigen biosynthesis protein
LHEGDHWDPIRTPQEATALHYSPKFSIILPVYNTPAEYLEKAIQSVQAQYYPNWELCICDDGSDAEHIRPFLERYHRDNARIQVVFSDRNQGISAASNRALQMATGEFLGFLDHDDELSPAALFEVARLLQQHSDADVIYSDEDKLERSGRRSDPFFKPDWSPEYLLSLNYACHFGVYRRARVEEVGGLRAELDGSQDYDLLLRVVEKTEKVFHIPEVLYHWRKAGGSTARLAGAKDYSTDAGQRALQQHLERCRIRGTVVNTGVANRYRVRPELAAKPLVSVIIPTRDGLEVLKRCLRSIESKTSYPHYEILIIDNGSCRPETQLFLQSLRHKVLSLPEPFNFSRLNNFGATHARGAFLLFMNNDTEVISPEWMTAMLEVCHLPGVGVAGAKLYYPGGTIQHAGVVLGIGQVAGHSHKHFPARNRGYFDSLSCIRNYSAVSAACMMVRREAFDSVGGFDENLKVAFNDVDLCLRLRRQGVRIAWTPYAELVHHESATRGFALDPQEVELMRKRWGPILAEDPYYSPNLTRARENFAIRL